MRSSQGKIVAVGIVIVLIIVGAFAFWKISSKSVAPAVVIPTPIVKEKGPVTAVIGQSVQGRKIEAYTYGDGAHHLVFVGGVHGGYEWNSVLLAYQFKDYLDKNQETLPENLTVTVIPSANPDGVYKVTGKEGRFTAADVSTSATVLASGRFNAHNVDLNRNFDCNWQPQSKWQSKVVSAGTAAFSEPEAVAIRDFMLKTKPEAVVFWHSQANAGYASQCKTGVLKGTTEILSVYTKAAGYPAVTTFDAYEITGDMADWLATVNIPAITVELKTHESVEWEKNLKGITALFDLFKLKN